MPDQKTPTPALSQTYSNIVQKLARVLKAHAAPSHDPKFWTVSPEMNIHQLFLPLPFLFADLLLTYLFFPDEPAHINTKKPYYNTLAVVCLVFFSFQFLFKYLRGVLITIFMPCHVILLVQALILAVFPQHTPLLFYCTPIPLCALLFPDLKNKPTLFEKTVYICQHSFQVVLPLVFDVTEGCPSFGEFVGYCVFGMFLFELLAFYVMVPLSYITGLNISFMLFPPSRSPFQGEWYRFNATVFTHLVGVPVGYLIYFVHVIVQSVVSLFFW